MTLILFIAILVVLILAHEFGHFIVAKAFGIRVDEFGIFFPPRIAAFKWGETWYSINWLPFGGFVRIFGENPPEAAAPSSELHDSRAFYNKSRWVQASCLVAGIAFNLIFAWLVLSAGYMAGLPTAIEHRGLGTVTNARPTVVEVLPNSPAQKAGLASGDIIESLQTGHDMLDVRTLNTDLQSAIVRNFIGAHPDESIVFIVLRSGAHMQFLAKPDAGFIPGKKAVGVQLDDIGVLRLPPHIALAQGALLGWDITRTTAVGLVAFFGQIFRGTADFTTVAGPIGITAFGAATLKQGFAAGAVLTALISINLAVINLLPIPGLDGGRLLIVGLEGILRRPISMRLVNSLTFAGFALLIALMLIVSYHDIARLAHPM